MFVGMVGTSRFVWLGYGLLYASGFFWLGLQQVRLDASMRLGYRPQVWFLFGASAGWVFKA